MYQHKKVFVIIPARGGSKGIPRKNIKLLNGKPLIAYSIEQAKQSEFVDKIIVSTDNEEIAEVAKRYGVEVQKRPDDLAQDSSLVIDAYIYTLKKLEEMYGEKIDFFISLQPTSPLRNSRDIDSAIKLFFEKDADSVIGVKEASHPINWFLKINKDGTTSNYFREEIIIKNRQEENKAYSPNGSIFVFKSKLIKENRSYYGNKTYPYIMPQERSVDIDNPIDFEFAEFIIKKKNDYRNQSQLYLNRNDVRKKNKMKIGNYEIENFGKPFIIVDICSNHNGDIRLAKKMVDIAQECGADCVKFQSFDTNIFSNMCYEDNLEGRKKLADRDPMMKKLFEKEHPELVKEIKDYMLNEDQLREIKKHCDERGILFLCTPFYKQSVDFHCDELNMEFVKIASMDLNNYPFIEYIARKNKPIILSTGMARLDEIEKAIETIKKTGNENIILLHCISIYPPEESSLNLNNIDLLREKFNLPIGFSDHTKGSHIPIAAVAKGACVIEKHFTLDRNLPGFDHHISADPKELKRIVKECNKVSKALGKKERIVTQNDLDKQKHFRRSLVVNKDLEVGHILTKEDIDFKRPGVSFEPGQLDLIVGKRIKRYMKYDEVIFPEDIDNENYSCSESRRNSRTIR